MSKQMKTSDALFKAACSKKHPVHMSGTYEISLKYKNLSQFLNAGKWTEHHIIGDGLCVMLTKDSEDHDLVGHYWEGDSFTDYGLTCLLARHQDALVEHFKAKQKAYHQFRNILEGGHKGNHMPVLKKILNGYLFEAYKKGWLQPIQEENLWRFEHNYLEHHSEEFFDAMEEVLADV